VTADLIDGYLAELRASLRRLPQERTAEILAEAEDHLRESVAAGVAIGMTEREAQEAAISAFGSVRAVVRAHNFRPRQVAADLVLTGLRLGWTGMFAIAASGFVALVMNHLVGQSFVGGTPAPAGTYPAAQCAHWLSNWPGAGTCGQAAVLEASSDAVSLRVIGGGLGGMLLLAAPCAPPRTGGAAPRARCCPAGSPRWPRRPSARQARSRSSCARSPAARSAPRPAQACS
jgi:hypothetical protein